MARTFRRHRPLHAQADINVTNLLDLAFVLLIIFMIATPLLNQEQTMPVNLPVESMSEQTAPDKNTKFITVTVRADGRYLIDADGNRPIAAAELGSRLRAVSLSTTDPVVRIRADATVPYQTVITLMDELKKAGLGKVSFDTQVKS